jgi:uncharacterized membrane protein HdeD (DUF308 family)
MNPSAIVALIGMLPFIGGAIAIIYALSQTGPNADKLLAGALAFALGIVILVIAGVLHQREH